MQIPSSLAELAALAEAYNASGHSVFGPSSSHMWLVCAGSLIPNMLAPDDAGEDAAYGTVAHEVSETWLKTGTKPRHMIGTKQFVSGRDPKQGFWIEIDQQMMDYVQQSVDRLILLPGDHIIEQKVDFSRLTPITNQRGTMDFAALTKGHAIVADHKYGKGVKVYAERNPQAMLYALGILFEFDWFYDFKTFTLLINQPRLDHFDEWTCTRDDLMEFAGYVKARAAAAWKINAPRTPDPKACQFCKVRQSCAANLRMQFKLASDQTAEAFLDATAEELNEFVTSIEGGSFEPEMLPIPSLRTEHLAALRKYRRMVEGWWNAAEDELMRRALARESIPGLKLVQGRSNREFTSRGDALSKLTAAGLKRDQIIEERMISPAQAEDLLIAAGHRRKNLPELLDGIVKKSPGKPTLAPLSDKRPPIEDSTEGAFAPINPETTEDEEL